MTHNFEGEAQQVAVGVAPDTSRGALPPFGGRPGDGSASWQDTIRSVSGACRTRNLPHAEAHAIAAWVDALEADLATPASPADRSILGSLGRLTLVELRLSRIVLEKGVTTARGEVKASVGEWRQVIRLKSDLLQRLTFRGGKAPVVDLAEYLAGLKRAQEASAGNGDRTSVEPGPLAAAGNGGSDAAPVVEVEP